MKKESNNKLFNSLSKGLTEAIEYTTHPYKNWYPPQMNKIVW